MCTPCMSAYLLLCKSTIATKSCHGSIESNPIPSDTIPPSPFQSNTIYYNPVQSNPMQYKATQSDPTNASGSRHKSVPSPFQVFASNRPQHFAAMDIQTRPTPKEMPRVTSSGGLEMQSNFETVLCNADLFVIVCIHVFPPPVILFSSTPLCSNRLFQTFAGLSRMFRFLNCPLRFISTPWQVGRKNTTYPITEFEMVCGRPNESGGDCSATKMCKKKASHHVHLLNLQSFGNSKSCCISNVQLH